MQESPWSAAAPSPPVTPYPATPYDLRPLSTGEILDRTFALYRLRFWLFAGISAVPATVTLLGGIATLIFAAYHPAVVTMSQPGENPFRMIRYGTAGVQVSISFLYLLIYGVANAATTSAVSSVYLGTVATIGSSYQAIRAAWPRWIGISLWQIGSAMWLPAIVLAAVFALVVSLGTSGALIGGFVGLLGFPASFVFAVIFYLRNSLGIPAGVMEGTAIRPSMRRSKELVAGRKGRIFLLYLVYFAMAMVAGAIQAPLVFLALKLHGAERYALQALQLFMGFAISMLVAPIPAIGLCLFYIDERVRREGFDVEYLMGEFSKPAPSISPGV